MAKHLKKRKKKSPYRRCNIGGLVIFPNELDVKIALAKRLWKDAGEKRYFRCGSHYHLTSQEARHEVDN